MSVTKPKETHVTVSNEKGNAAPYIFTVSIGKHLYNGSLPCEKDVYAEVQVTWLGVHRVQLGYDGKPLKLQEDLDPRLRAELEKVGEVLAKVKENDFMKAFIASKEAKERQPKKDTAPLPSIQK